MQHHLWGVPGVSPITCGGISPAGTMSRQQEALVAQGVRAMLATVLSDIQVRCSSCQTPPGGSRPSLTSPLSLKAADAARVRQLGSDLGVASSFGFRLLVVRASAIANCAVRLSQM